jgi:hypothetical protein
MPYRETQIKIAFCAFLLWLIALLISVTPISAQSSTSAEVEYRSLPGQSKPHLAIIKAAWHTPLDYLYIFQETQAMDTAKNWRDNLNFDNAYWFFDSREKTEPQINGLANLIIKFSRNERSLVADIYDDQNQDGLVSYRLENGKLSLTESPHWTVRFIAPDGWWERYDKANFNLDIFVDGKVQVLPEIGNNTTDGKTDYAVQIRADATRRADTDLRHAFTPFGVKTTLFKNQGSLDVPLSNSLFWVYLSRSSKAQFERAANSFPAPLVVDWAKSKIALLGEFVASNAANNRIITTDFNLRNNLSTILSETFDLSQSKDDQPDLHLTYRPQKGLNYTLDANHNNLWDYRLNFSGAVQPENSSENYLGFQVSVPKREQLAAWATAQKWQTVSFIEAVGGTTDLSSFSSWDDNRFFGRLPVGMRGEYSENYNQPPQFYFSPVDNRLHLWGAKYGIWQDSADSWLETRSSDNTAVDQWYYYKAGQLIQKLVYRAGYLFYANEKSARFIKVDNFKLHSEVFAPPKTPATWRDLSRLYRQYSALAVSKPAIDSWFNQFDTAGVVSTPLAELHVLKDKVFLKQDSVKAEIVNPQTPTVTAYVPQKLEVNGFILQDEAGIETNSINLPQKMEALRPLYFSVRLKTHGVALADRFRLELLANNEKAGVRTVELGQIEKGDWFNFNWLPHTAGDYAFSVRVTPLYTPEPDGYFSQNRLINRYLNQSGWLKFNFSDDTKPVLISTPVKTVKILPVANYTVAQVEQTATNDLLLWLAGAITLLLALNVAIFAVTRKSLEE